MGSENIHIALETCFMSKITKYLSNFDGVLIIYNAG